MALSKGIRAGIALGKLPEALEAAKLQNAFTQGRVKQLEAANKLVELTLAKQQGVQAEPTRIATERLAQPQMVAGASGQATPASTPMTDAQRIEAFAQQYNPQCAQQPPMQGPPEPIVVEPQPGPLAGPDTLRDVGLAYLRHGKGREGMAMLKLADDQRKMQEMGQFYQRILASDSSNPQLRSQAMAGLGSLLLQMVQADQAIELFKKALPPSTLALIEKTTGETKNLLLGQLQQGRTPKIARAQKQAQRVKTAKAEAHAKRAMFEAQPRQTAADAGITTTASGERVRTTQPTEHGSR